MFTGIIADLGSLKDRIDGQGVSRFVISSPRLNVHEAALGASIACSGCCLTVVEKGISEAGEAWFSADVSEETFSKTTLRDWTVGSPINLERALCLGDELGGHLVSGHVDSTVQVLEKRQEGDYWFFQFRIPQGFEKFVAPKGSVTLDGISLTVNHVVNDTFDVAIIPHTYKETTLQYKDIGSFLNFEVDLLARYIARLYPEKP